MALGGANSPATKVLLWNLQLSQLAGNPLEFLPSKGALSAAASHTLAQLLHRTDKMMLRPETSPRLGELIGNKPLTLASATDTASIAKVPPGLVRWLESRHADWAELWPTLDPRRAADLWCRDHGARWAFWSKQTLHEWLCDDGSGGKANPWLPTRRPCVAEVCPDLALGASDQVYGNPASRCARAKWMRYARKAGTTFVNTAAIKPVGAPRHDLFKVLVWDCILDAILARLPEAQVANLFRELRMANSELRMRRVAASVQASDVAILLSVPASQSITVEGCWLVRSQAGEDESCTMILARKDTFREPVLEHLPGDGGVPDPHVVACTLTRQDQSGRVNVIGVRTPTKRYEARHLAERLEALLQPNTILGVDFGEDPRMGHPWWDVAVSLPRLAALLEQAHNLPTDLATTNKQRSPFQPQLSKMFLHDFEMRDVLFVGDRFEPVWPNGLLEPSRCLPNDEVPSDHAPLTVQLNQWDGLRVEAPRPAPPARRPQPGLDDLAGVPGPGGSKLPPAIRAAFPLGKRDAALSKVGSPSSCAEGQQHTPSPMLESGLESQASTPGSPGESERHQARGQASRPCSRLEEEDEHLGEGCQSTQATSPGSPTTATEAIEKLPFTRLSLHGGSEQPSSARAAGVFEHAGAPPLSPGPLWREEELDEAQTLNLERRVDMLHGMFRSREAQLLEEQITTAKLRSELEQVQGELRRRREEEERLREQVQHLEGRLSEIHTAASGGQVDATVIERLASSDKAKADGATPEQLSPQSSAANLLEAEAAAEERQPSTCESPERMEEGGEPVPEQPAAEEKAEVPEAVSEAAASEAAVSEATTEPVGSQELLPSKAQPSPPRLRAMEADESPEAQLADNIASSEAAGDVRGCPRTVLPADSDDDACSDATMSVEMEEAEGEGPEEVAEIKEAGQSSPEKQPAPAAAPTATAQETASAPAAAWEWGEDAEWGEWTAEELAAWEDPSSWTPEQIAAWGDPADWGFTVTKTAAAAPAATAEAKGKEAEGKEAESKEGENWEDPSTWGTLEEATKAMKVIKALEQPKAAEAVAEQQQEGEQPSSPPVRRRSKTQRDGSKSKSVSWGMDTIVEMVQEEPSAEEKTPEKQPDKDPKPNFRDTEVFRELERSMSEHLRPEDREGMATEEADDGQLEALVVPPEELLAELPESEDEFIQRCRQVAESARMALVNATHMHMDSIEMELKAAMNAQKSGERELRQLVRQSTLEETLEDREQLQQVIAAHLGELKDLQKAMVKEHSEELSAEDAEVVGSHLEAWTRLCENEQRLLRMPSALGDLPETFIGLLAEIATSPEDHKPDEQWDSGHSPVHWAAQHGRRDFIEYFCRHSTWRPWIDAYDEKGRTPLFYAQGQRGLALTAWLRAEAGATAPIHQASFRPPELSTLPARIRGILDDVEAHGWRSAKWGSQYTMLHWAAARGNKALCRYVVQLGADPHAQDWMMRTPLDCAREASQKSAVDLLVELMRRPTETAVCLSAFRKTSTASSLSSDDSDSRASRPRSTTVGLIDLSAFDIQDPKEKVASRGSLPAAYMKIWEQSEEIGWENMEWADGYSLLHWAAKNDLTEICARLMSQKADPSAKDNSGKDAFDYAREAKASAALHRLQSGPPANLPPVIMTPISHDPRMSRVVRVDTELVALQEMARGQAWAKSMEEEEENSSEGENWHNNEAPDDSEAESLSSERSSSMSSFEEIDLTNFD